MWPNPPAADLVTSTENILNGKLHFCAVSPMMRYKGLKYWVHFCSSLKNTPKNICDIVFERAKGRDGTVNRTSDYVDAAVKRGSIKKVLWEISQNSQENGCARVSILIKLDVTDLQLLLNRESRTSVFLSILQNL